MPRKRSSKRVYMLDVVWASIKRNPGCSAQQVSVRTQEPRQRIRNALQSLKQMGSLRYEGYGPSAKWFAVGRRPQCMWGTHPNSLKNLEAITLEDRMENLRKAGKIPRETQKVAPVARPGCELDKCWPVLMSSAQRAAD